jgi:outer membrane murein-binding lipoprotein Lpp
MKILVLAGVAGAALLAGCAPVHYTKADVDGLSVCHVDKMDQVNQQARPRNTHVQWVNCPRATLRVI